MTNLSVNSVNFKGGDFQSNLRRPQSYQQAPAAYYIRQEDEGFTFGKAVKYTAITAAVLAALASAKAKWLPEAGGEIGKKITAAGNKINDAAKAAWNTVTGWFSKKGKKAAETAGSVVPNNPVVNDVNNKLDVISKLEARSQSGRAGNLTSKALEKANSELVAAQEKAANAYMGGKAAETAGNAAKQTAELKEIVQNDKSSKPLLEVVKEYTETSGKTAGKAVTPDSSLLNEIQKTKSALSDAVVTAEADQTSAAEKLVESLEKKLASLQEQAANSGN